MTYRAPEEALAPSLTKLLEGVQEFDVAVRNRVRSGEWMQQHLEEIMELRGRVCALELDLAELRRQTW